MSFTTFSGLLSRRYNNTSMVDDNCWETSIPRTGDDNHGEFFSSIIYPSYSDFPPGFNPNEFLDAFLSESNSLNWRNSSSENQQSKEVEEKYYSDPSTDVSLLQSSSNIFEEGDPQRKQDTFTILESGMLVDFSSPMTNTTNFQDPYLRNFSEMALAVPEIHSTLAPQLNCHKSINEDEDGDLNDGYNWRKYGEKRTKGGENPRSYYRCGEPNCTMKKKVGRNLDGKIIAIMYKGNHNHPNPSKPVGSANVPLVNELYASSYTDSGNLNQQSVGGVENQLGAHTKRLKGGNGIYSYLFNPSGGRAIKEPRVVVQTTTEIDILDDGYRWRKYGQKVVKGNPNPRNYYKCVSPGCNVKKHVERAADDIKSVMTTYEGKHNHDVPQERSSFASRIASLTNNFATPSSSSSPSLHDTSLSLSSPRANNENQASQELTTLPFIVGIPNFGRSLIGTSYANEGPSSNNEEKKD
ncbi:hypothetical protein S83_005296 [Arachis hypogaea]|uniref:WRKY domain-containing protein n=1 Tax=Arachis hypogaea TaxID=3818 RepID=A0A445EA57_ARAHY|nr:uncharacterized protein DS421_2g55360 [Arachis hypogaea]RYR72308.1 hypothetical protein Ahy_A02g006510 isoform A [Arachis hypogaea]